MTWLGLLLVGVAVSDLVGLRGPSGSRAWVSATSGAASAVVLGVVAGLVTALDLLALVAVAVLVVAWAVAVRRSEHAEARAARLPLGILVGGLLLGVLLAPVAGAAHGPWATWLAAAPWGSVAALDPDRALLLLGVLLAQVATGNEVVRLVLAATGTVPPAVPAADDPSLQLKGGRLLGPMERVVILGLGLAGQLTAASIVIAAKGLLRWPELSSQREQQAVHRLTEYFLVGSFVSWSVALVGLALVR